MSDLKFSPVITNDTDSIEKLNGQVIFDIGNKSISIDIDNSRFAVQSVDSELSEISKNPVQNKVIAEKLYAIEEKISEIESPETPELPTDIVRGTGKLFTLTSEEAVQDHLVYDDLGALISYIGEDNEIENPTKVGDTCSQVYFDTAKSAEEVYADLLKLDWSNPEINGDASGFYLIDNGGSFDKGTRYGVVAINMDGVIIMQTIVDGGGVPLFAYSTTSDPSDLGLTTWGWQGSSPVTISPSFDIAGVKYKKVWGGWLSTHENGFASGSLYKKNTIYMVAEKEASKIEADDTIDALYFNTSLSDEEMLTNLSALTYENGMAILVEGNKESILIAIDLNAVGASGYALVSMQPDTTDVLYASETMEANNDIGTPATSKGWNTTLIIDGAYPVNTEAGDVSAVNQQGLWSSYISKEPFGAGRIIAKHIVDPSLEESELPEVGAADAGKVLSVTTSGTWGAAALETAFQQINISLDDTSFVTKDIDPNVFYVFDQPLQVSLTINLNEGKPGVMHEYMFQFSVGYDLTLTLPASVQWINQEPPTFTAGHTYQVSILNNLAVCGEF